ncbi:MAG TPA: hypothetical protein VMF31_04960 [Solirubrobacterales bacterium]|nr:hypothetical protein [Solirubrobacterales bacterium]
MPCLVALFAIISPRLALFVVLVFSDWVGKAMDGWVVPVLGFFFLPWTTLAYIVMWNVGSRGVDGFEWLIVIFAFFVDIMSYVKTTQAREARTY